MICMTYCMIFMKLILNNSNTFRSPSLLPQAKETSRSVPGQVDTPSYSHRAIRSITRHRAGIRTQKNPKRLAPDISPETAGVTYLIRPYPTCSPLALGRKSMNCSTVPYKTQGGSAYCRIRTHLSCMFCRYFFRTPDGRLPWHRASYRRIRHRNRGKPRTTARDAILLVIGHLHGRSCSVR